MLKFKRRHPQVHTKKGVALDYKRAQNLSEEVVQEWYDGLLLIVRRKAIKPRNSWNADEIGNAFGMVSNQRVIGSADTESTVLQTSNEREWVTAIECISAEGVILTPLVIFKGKHI